MIFIWISYFCQAKLILQSPHQIANTILDYSISTFGAPALYPLYGKILILSSSPCSLSGNLTNFFILIDDPRNCSYEDLAFSAQKLGSSLVIFKIDPRKTIIPSNRDKASFLNIPVIGINSTSYNLISQHSKSIIWATYSFDLNKQSGALFILVLSGNYTLDYKYYRNIYNFLDASLSRDNFIDFKISYLKANDSLVKSPNDDCYYLDFAGPICMETTKEAKGFQKIKNSLKIWYNLCKNSNNDTLNNVLNLYKNCQFDYSEDCLFRYLKTGKNSEIGQILNNNSLSVDYRKAPFVVLNDVKIYWPDYFAQSVYLSDLDSQNVFGRCRPDCSAGMLKTITCEHSCNYSECGFDNLKCLYKDGCLGFLINDGQCDPFCFMDPDCSMCVQGCSYEAMSNGYCPAACIGSCYSNCNQSIWCSPGCSYSDLSSGLCPPTCSLNCFEKCSPKIWCSPGCAYSDLSIGICSKSCSSLCLSYCKNTIECSPGCLFSDLYKGICSPACRGNCLALCANNSDICSPGCFYTDLLNANCSSKCTPECMAFCKNISDECSPGCYYSELSAGNCSDSCPIECLAYCKGFECSPQCYYEDWFQGYCSSECSENCLQICLKNICSNGCTYSMIQGGFCPINCTGECFAYCDHSNFCSPGCRYSDWELLTPSAYCTEDCREYYYSNCYAVCGPMENCNNSCSDDCCVARKGKNDAKVIYIALGTVIPVCLIGILIWFVVYKIRKRRVMRSILEDIFSMNDEKLAKSMKGTKEFDLLHPVEFNNKLKFIGEPICSIDIAEFKHLELVVVTPCFHVFHPGCLKEWINDSISKGLCPNCSYNLVDYKIMITKI